MLSQDGAFMKALGIIWELSVYVLGPELTKVGRGDEMSNESGFQLAGTGPESYERYIGVFMAPFVDAVIQRAKLTRGSAVLDVACGTGFVARAASSLVGSTGRVAGLDINPGMLEVARAASANANPSIEWHQASAEEIPFEDATFDAVLCSQGIMFLPDLRNGVKEFCRVAAPGGRVRPRGRADRGLGHRSLRALRGSPRLSQRARDAEDHHGARPADA